MERSLTRMGFGEDGFQLLIQEWGYLRPRRTVYLPYCMWRNELAL